MPELELVSVHSLVGLQPMRLCHSWSHCFLQAEKEYVMFTPIFKPVANLAVVTKSLYIKLPLPILTGRNR